MGISSEGLGKCIVGLGLNIWLCAFQPQCYSYSSGRNVIGFWSVYEIITAIIVRGNYCVIFIVFICNILSIVCSIIIFQLYYI